MNTQEIAAIVLRVNGKEAQAAIDEYRRRQKPPDLEKILLKQKKRRERDTLFPRTNGECNAETYLCERLSDTIHR